MFKYINYVYNAIKFGLLLKEFTKMGKKGEEVATFAVTFYSTVKGY